MLASNARTTILAPLAVPTNPNSGQIGLVQSIFSFSFGWKTIADEIAEAIPSGRWNVFYWIGLSLPMLALMAWVITALVLHYVGL